jgi:CDP-glucose 4,6-dehydratase
VYTYETNVIGTLNLLEACRYQKSIRSIVNVTTDKVYENRSLNRGYREDETLNGSDPYSNSKSCSELVTESYRKSFYCDKNSASLSTARSGNVIGGGDFAKDRLIPDCIRAIKAGKPVVVRNPASTRPYQHVLDCLFGYLLLARKQYDKKLAGNYNFGPDEAEVVNNAALIDMFLTAWGSGKSVHRHDNGPKEARFLKLDCTKAKKKLGWKPQIKLKKAILMAVEWYGVLMARGRISDVTDSQITDYFRKG